MCEGGLCHYAEVSDNFHDIDMWAGGNKTCGPGVF